MEKPEQSKRISTSDDLEVGAYLSIAQKLSKEESKTKLDKDKLFQPGILIVDFGSQYSRLIARRIRELNTYCEIVTSKSKFNDISSIDIKGIILSGGPSSIYQKDSPKIPDWIFRLKLPILGICYGMQALSFQLGGKVSESSKREYGYSAITVSKKHNILKDLSNDIPVWMSHGDKIINLPPGFKSYAFSENSQNAVIANDSNYIGIQFHPEVTHTPQGKLIIDNFISICECPKNWIPKSVVEHSIKNIREQVGNSKVICALSGGVDSSVVAILLDRAIGKQLTCIFVDNGLMRKEEPERIRKIFEGKFGLNLKFINASKTFLTALKDITDPEDKRKIIGREFISVFEKHSSKLGNVEFLAQGTLYPDVIESKTSDTSTSDKIKTHHNVGGLPENMKMRLIEPLKFMFKDEVRLAGLELKLDKEIVNRQPFPGPGLAIRIIGEVTSEKLRILKNVDWIVMNEIKKNDVYNELWQSFAVLTNTQTVGVMGDKRTYSYVVALRCVKSEDAMTADWARLPYDLLGIISTRIVNEVPEINRVVYDITSKPPGTIEWE